MTDQTNPQPQGLHVITLISSTAPIALPQFQSPRLEGLAVFRSRRVEDGRERYRIHIGYFASPEDAEGVLEIVRETYPWAFVGPAPQANLGSLDDTASTRFTVLRAAELGAPPPAKAAGAAKAAAATKAAAPAVAPAPASTPAPARAVAPARAAPPARAAGTAPAAGAARAAGTPAGAIPTLTAVPMLKTMQRYAVQLLWSKQPIDLAKIPNIGIFSGYLLYAVETAPGPRRMFGMRLGFYDDELSARLVALYVRPTFKASVVPVSEREVASASRATIRLTGSRPTRGRITPREQWPQGAVAVAFSPAANDMASPQL